jgi:hypothetical protein
LPEKGPDGSEGAANVPLSDEQKRVYQQSLEMAQHQLDEIEKQIEQELAAVRERLAVLQERRKATLQMYDAACALLGVPNELESEEESEESPAIEPSA